MKKASQQKKQKNKTNFSFLQFILLIICCYFGFHCFSLYFEYRENQMKIQEIKSEIKQLELDVKQNKYVLDTSDEKAFIEKAARERFGYAYPNEVIYIAVP